MVEGIDANVTCQQGLITRWQALLEITEGQLEWLIRSGTWVPVAHGVYRVRPPEDEYAGQVWQAVLHTRGIASHRCAAYLLCLDAFDHPAPTVEVITTRDIRDVPNTIIHKTRELPGAWFGLAGIPTTSPVDTLTSLGEVASRDDVEAAVDACVRREWTTWAELRAAVEVCTRRGARGPSVLREILDLRGPNPVATDSLLETRGLQLIRLVELPTPVLQFPILYKGRRIATADMAYPEHDILIEFVGRKAHSTRSQLNSDCRRANAIHLLKRYTILSFTWDDVTRNAWNVAGQIAKALGLPWPRARSAAPRP